eukprot:Gb_13563 [translate_table: standard]
MGTIRSSRGLKENEIQKMGEEDFPAALVSLLSGVGYEAFYIVSYAPPSTITNDQSEAADDTREANVFKLVLLWIQPFGPSPRPSIAPSCLLKSSGHALFKPRRRRGTTG